MRPTRQFAPLLVVGVAVILNILSAIVLKYFADLTSPSLILLVAGVGFVVILNGLRFAIWGYAHKHFNLSSTYPLTSLFFPLMLLVAFLYGDPIQWRQVVGVIMITAGVAWLSIRVKI